MRVVLLTTIVSALVFGACWAAVRYGVVDLERLLGRSRADPQKCSWPRNEMSKAISLARDKPTLF